MQAAETLRYFEAEQNELSVCTWCKIVKKVCLIGVRATILTLENKNKNRLQCWIASLPVDIQYRIVEKSLLINFHYGREFIQKEIALNVGLLILLLCFCFLIWSKLFRDTNITSILI